MKDVVIVLWIIMAFIATSFWEAYIEGQHGGAEKQVGWKIKVGKYYLNGYHFWLWVVAYPLLLTLPLVINYSSRVLGLILIGYFLGQVIEDFLWFVVNPQWPFRHFRPDKADWFPWMKFGKKYGLPFFYVPYLIFAFLAWWFLVRG
ncbi:hypothetical protein KJ733_03980 [Patescibacteria group bacterium]|nr:hypothetical protein [Patescibacteria group bacterium]